MASISTQMASALTSLPSPSSSPQWKYHVFLSFRGEDTRKSFTDHLYAALKQKGIIAFRDDQSLERGKEIAPELLKAIEESKFSIVVFSRNYASSIWCLDELVKILECMNTKGQLIFPVFYDVDPSDVRKQRGHFEKAFAKHEEDFGQNTEKVKKWRTAMTNVANLSGWDSQNRHESKLIKEIVEEIFTRLNRVFSTTAKNLIGIDSYMEKLNLYLGTRSDDVRIIGIHGMGGIGKTTLARFVFDRISNKFEDSSFLANVREVSERNGLVVLQQQFLSEILKAENIRIWDIYEGSNMLRNRLCHKKVLVVLDDVDKPYQLENLVGQRHWFGLGSRIIITTRDVHLLVQHGVDAVYEMEELDHLEAFKLFSLKAFKNVHPEEDFVELSKEVVRYARGLPLALEVLGSFLYGKSVDEWISALERLKEDSEKAILDRLEISFHGLKPTEKKIFLDVACFFKGMDKDYVMKLLDSFGFYAAIGIRVLIDKSLITIVDNNRVWMHDLLQEMGQKIVWKESPDEPGKRSRLWVDEDVYHVLTKNSGTEAVEMMTFNLFKQKEVNLSVKAFLKMDKLRLLKISNVQLSQGLEYLSNELRLLEWHGYPLKSLPLSFKPEKIVELNMHRSHIKQLWNGTRTLDRLDRLKFINLSHSQALIRTPDLTGAPNLEKLILEGCCSLVEVHPSIWLLKGLIILNMKDCRCLQRLPSSIEMQSLQVLILSGCFKLKKFPEVKGNMEHLSELYLDGTAIEELPLSIEHLTGLVLLNLENCKNLISLPSSICHLNSLKTLALSGCSKLGKLPEKLGNVECLEELDVSGTAIRQTPSSIVLLKNLKTLSFQGCGGQPPKPWSSLLSSLLLPRRSSDSMCLLLPPLSNLCSLTLLNLSNCNLLEGAVPSDLGYLSSLKILDLSDNEFVSLPVSISGLSSLEALHLEGCKRLQLLPQLPTNVEFVGADDCIELENFPNPLNLCTSERSTFNLFNCHGLVDHENCSSRAWTWMKTYLKGLPRPSNRFDVCLPGSEIPDWFSQQSMGSSVSIDLLPHWNNSNLLGFAMCAIFRLRRPASVSNSDNYRRSYRHRPTNVVLACFFMNDQGEFLYHNHTDAWFPTCSLVKKCAQIGSDHIWLLYRRAFLVTDSLNEINRITLSFRGQPGSGWDLEIKKCAGRLVYAQDVEELQQTIISNSSYEDFDTSVKEGIISQPSFDGCDGPELGGSRSSTEEPQPKRLKKL